MFVWFSDHNTVYKMMFVWGTILSVATTTIFYFIDPDEDERLAKLAKAKAEGADDDDAEEGEPGAFYHGPVGAHMCDRLCFPAVFTSINNEEV